MSNEATLMREIQLALADAGYHLFRNNVGCLQDRNGKFIRFGLCEGSSDLIGFNNDGKFVAVEVKTGKGLLTQKQKQFLLSVQVHGGIAFCARSVDEALQKIRGVESV